MQVASSTNLGVLWIGVSAATVFCVFCDTRVDGSTAAERELTAAVTSDGFAVLDGVPSDRHAIVVDRDGGNTRRLAIPVVAADARLVGAWSGISVGWRDSDKVRYAQVAGDGELGKASVWGKKVVALCEGLASNEHEWGIGWREKDGRIWVLHGPTERKERAAGAGGMLETPAAATEWCGVTNAGTDMMLMWRDDTGRMFMNQCNAKRCESKVDRLPVDHKHQYLGLACVQKECLVAARGDSGETLLTWVNPKRKVTWTVRISDALPDTDVALVAAGDKAFAVAYVGREGAAVQRVISTGSMVRAWADPHATATPALAWAGDRLLVAHRHGDHVAPEIVQLPR